MSIGRWIIKNIMAVIVLMAIVWIAVILLWFWLIMGTFG
jgi:hypothetical protein